MRHYHLFKKTKETSNYLHSKLQISATEGEEQRGYGQIQSKLIENKK